MQRRTFIGGLGVALAAGTRAVAAARVPLPDTRAPGDLCGLGFQAFDGGALSAQITTFAHPFAAGVLRADATLELDGRPAQLDVSATHEDGSVRHAMLAVALPPLSAGAVHAAMLRQSRQPVNAAASTTGAPTLTCDVTVTLKPSDGQPAQVDVGAAFRAGPVQRWRSGPLVSEGRVRIPVPALAEDFELVCDLACFADATPPRLDIGFCREKIRVVVRTSAEPMKAPDIAYAVTVSDRGNPVYKVDIARHALGQNWHHVIGETPVHVVFDIHALRASGAVIHDPTLGVDERTLRDLRIRDVPPFEVVTIYGSHLVRDILQYMGQTGGRPDIGPETTPVACWLISQDPAVAQYCLWQAEGASGIPWHMRDVATGDYAFIDSYPDLWNWAGGQVIGKHGYDRSGSGGGWSVDYAHQPDCSFVPWLLTGRRKWLDDLMAQATDCVNWYNPAYRQSGKGYICQYPNSPYNQQVRGQAWSLRQVAQAASFAPDSERLKAPLATVTRTNLAGLRAVSTANAEGELSYWVLPRPATWEQDYFATTMAAADALGFADAWPVMQAMMKFLAGIMLTPDFHAKDCCAYLLPITPETNTWRAAREAFEGKGSGMGVRWAENTFRPYYAARRGTLSYAARRGDALAQQALKWFLANAGEGPSSGATDAYWRSDPTFAIG